MERKNRLFGLIIIGILYFIFGFVTWLNGTLIPFLKTACELNEVAAYLVTFAFYISYFVWALPSSGVLKRTGFKNGLSIGLFVMSIGAGLFIPAAYMRSYILFLTALFIMGSGLALMQTAVNPYVTILGPIESAAKRISIMGICNKLAGILAPIILATILLSGFDQLTVAINGAEQVAEKEMLLQELSMRLVRPYTVMTIILLFLALLIYFIKLPDVEEEENKNISENSNQSIWKQKRLWFGVIALFFYVGVEVIAGDTVIQYGISLGIAQESAKYFTSFTLIAMLLGYFIGVIIIPRFINQSQALLGCAITGLIFTTIAILVPSGLINSFPFIDLGTFQPIEMQIPYTVLFISLLGLANSLVWPAIWPLALKDAGAHTKTGSALLIMSIAGGALLPLIYGGLTKNIGGQNAYIIALPCYAVILSFAIYCMRKDKTVKKA